MVKISNEVKVVKINICVRVFRVDYLLCNPCTMKKNLNQILSYFHQEIIKLKMSYAQSLNN